MKSDQKEMKLALLGQLMSIMGQHALSGCIEPDKDDKEDDKEEVMIAIPEEEDESTMDDRAKRLKKLKALAASKE